MSIRLDQRSYVTKRVVIAAAIAIVFLAIAGGSSAAGLSLVDSIRGYFGIISATSSVANNGQSRAFFTSNIFTVQSAESAQVVDRALNLKGGTRHPLASTS